VVQSAMRHLSSGVLLAAVSRELTPLITVHNFTAKLVVFGSFMAGTLINLICRWISNYAKSTSIDILEFDPDRINTMGVGKKKTKRDEIDLTYHGIDQEQEEEEEQPIQFPSGFILAVIIDSFVDGITIAVTWSAGERAGQITCVALAIEAALLGMTTASTLRRVKMPFWKLVCVLIIAPLPILVMGVICAAFIDFIQGAITGLLSFGTANLLYMVVEELMREAHEHTGGDESWFVSLCLFLGFIITLVVE